MTLTKTNKETDIENVLCFPAELLEDLGVPNKFTKDVDRYFDNILQKENLLFIPRDKAETDPSYKQIIPYHILYHTSDITKYFVYQRTAKSGELRLRKQWSLGVGGHINTDDVVDADADFGLSIYSVGADRELNEEVEIPPVSKWETIGFIYDDSTEVGKVHFGFVELVGLISEEVKVRDECLDFVGWLTKDELVEKRSFFETWSKILIDNFI